MKKVFSYAGKWLPLILFILCSIYLIMNVVSSYRFIPYNEWAFCGTSLGVYALTGVTALTDKTKWDDKVKQVGCGMLPILTVAALCCLSAEVNIYMAFVTGAIEMTVVWFVFERCTELSGFVTFIRGLTMAAMVFLAVFMFQPMIAGRDAGVDDKGAAFTGRYVANYSAVKAPDDEYTVTVKVTQAGLDLGIGRFEGIGSDNAVTYTVGRSEYTPPKIEWRGEDLYVNGEKEVFVLE